MAKLILCVDFDGVIHSYTSGWQGVDVIADDPVPGAIEWLMAHLPMPEPIGHFGDYSGPEAQIYSSRSKDASGVRAMKDWLIKHGLPSAYITDDVLKFPTQKPAAFLTIDDRAVCFNGVFPTTEEMLSFKPWYKRDYPDGQLGPSDEGALQIAIGTKDGNVMIDFGKQIEWLAFGREHAIALAKMIVKHAESLP